ncbi:TPA: response regulator transcription factor, partial [Streptococcus equi subsp. zooepidemicus]|nr:response regulator transcription factor [Streptococcus equi subsp. zooepidemicus]
TKCELNIVRLYSNGMSRKQLAKELNTNVRSLAVSLSRIYQKLGVKNYQEMIDKVRELGYVDSF